jgi:hypothetical protein
MSGALHVYLTRADWLRVTAAFERQLPVRYVRVGAVEGEPTSWSSIADIDDFGVAPTGDPSSNPQWLVLPSDVEPVARVAERRAHGERRIVDRLGNPTGFVVRPGGAFGSLAVIAGEVPLAPGDTLAAQAREVLVDEVHRVARSIQSYRVGPDAEGRLRRGARLTPYLDGDTLYDLSDPRPSTP